MVVEATVKPTVTVPAPGAAMVAGLKTTVTPAGWPLAVRAIAALNPPEMAAVIFDVTLPPCAAETVVGEADRVKLAELDAGASASIKGWPLGLPIPVTKS